ncbi:hypothetical protein [Streptomyces silaceus]|uniref:hypothetical protein n=1 Tax=Streptomyces silaceus TaxID=545123 RepID=UPI0006EBBB76|nr:hypothetical protein [Streptomyces silaceus]
MTARPQGSISPRHCPACRAPILRQLVGDRAALHITADLTPLTPAEQTAVREPNRLIWCLRTSTTGTQTLAWIQTWHPPDCPHPHVTEHRCTAPPRTAPPVRPAPPAPDTLF